MILNSGDPTYVSESGANTRIDITITDNFSTMLKWETAPELYNSDHFPIFIGTEINALLSHKQKRWCLQSGNWNGYRDSLELLKIHINPAETCGQICKSIVHAAHKNDNVRVSEGLANGASKRWWNGACREAWMKKKAAFNQYRKKRDQISFISFKRARAQLRIVIRKARQDSWDNYVSSINSSTKSSEVWKKIKAIDRKSQSPKKIVLKKDNDYIYDDIEVADLFS